MGQVTEKDDVVAGEGNVVTRAENLAFQIRSS
jgi:hypothetical protein